MTPSILFAIATAVCLPWSTLAEPKVLRMDFDKSIDNSQVETLVRREDGISLTLQNVRKQVYLVNVTIGTPPQNFRLHIDTGSSDTWVPSDRSEICRKQKAECRVNGAYNERASSTGVNLPDKLFNNTYVDKSSYRGNFFKDTIRFNAVSMDEVQIGLARTSRNVIQSNIGADTVGLMGIGFEQNQGGALRGEPTYPNIVTEMKTQGFIKSRAFSLYLNSMDAPTGSILFGGVDKSKYKGPLIAAPMIPEHNKEKITSYAIECTSFTASSPAGAVDFMPPNVTNVIYTVLDSGAADSYIPPNLIPSLYSYLGATTDNADTGGLAAVPCNISTANANFTFGFGGSKGPQITVPISDLVDLNNSKLQGYRYADGTPACPLLIGPSTDPNMLLGASFLRSAYAVYNLESETIALAQSDLASKGGSDIEEIAADTGTPGVESEAPELGLDVSDFMSQSAAIKASASVAATQLAQADPIISKMLTDLPAQASVTAQGAPRNSTGSLGTNIAKATGSAIAPNSPSFTGGAGAIKPPAVVAASAVALGLFFWAVHGLAI